MARRSRYHKPRLKGFDCRDCGVDTFDANEYYMVRNDLWRSVRLAKGMLCVGCLEARLGRQLVSVDFLECPLNRGCDEKRSDRLRDRLGGFVTKYPTRVLMVADAFLEAAA